MKIVDEITVTVNVNYGNQPSTVKSSLGLKNFYFNFSITIDIQYYIQYSILVSGVQTA